MALILLVWFVLLIFFTGFGLFVLRCFKIKRDQGSCVDLFWIGWAFVIFILQIWHLAFRIDYKAFLLVAAIGLAGIVWNWSEIRRRYLNKKKIKQNAVLLLLLAIFALLIANHAAFRPINDDSAEYHLSSVRWASSYPIIPGLGNLHVRLAYNSSYFLYAALLEILESGSYHFANGILLLLLFAQIFLAIRRLVKDSGKPRLSDFYAFLFFYVAVNYISHYNISSPSPDLPVFILGILISIQWMAFLENSKDDRDETEYRLFYITTLAVAGIVVKLSYIVLGISVLLLAFGVWVIRKQKRGKVTYYMPAIIRTAQCMAIGLLPWLLRGIILSGYLLYPSSVIAFPVEWRISRAAALNDWDWIRAWGHSTIIGRIGISKNWEWICRWTERVMLLNRDEIIPPFISAAIGFLIIAIRSLRKKLTINKANIALFLLPPILSIIYWFHMAPALRFAGAAFYILGFGILTFAIGDIKSIQKILVNTMIAAYITAFILFCLLNVNIFKPLNLDISLIPLGGDRFGLYPTPKVELKEFVTRSGLTLYVPVKGEKCWDAPLPCTPYPNANLKLRRAGDIRYGFVFDPPDDSNPEYGTRLHKTNRR